MIHSILYVYIIIICPFIRFPFFIMDYLVPAVLPDRA